MIVLAFDQSPEVTGYAVGDPSGPPAFGSLIHSDYGGNEGLLMSQVYDQVTNLAKSFGAECIFWEQIIIYPERLHLPSLAKQFAVKNAIEMAGARALHIDVYEAPISKWRPWFLGTDKTPKGTKDRTAWFKACAERECTEIGLWPGSHHEAEAVGIWHWAQQEIDADFRFKDGPRHRRAASRRDAERIDPTLERKKAKPHFVKVGKT